MKICMLVLSLLVAGTAAQAHSTAVATVHIKDFAFEPASLTVNVGDTVAFVNDDDDAHTVTSANGRFDSKGLDTHSRWEYTFGRVGTFTYFCALHPYMKGAVIVRATTR